jgi:hypothetical protein
MSVLDEIKKLDEQKQALLAKAKDEALQQATKAVAMLRELGFNYKLVEAGDNIPFTAPKRRTGVRNDVLNAVKAAPNGISRSDILEALGAKGDKRAEQSISNALANLKKAEQLTLNDGVYTVTSK